MAVFSNSGFVVVFLFVLVLIGERVNSEPVQDKQALLAFFNQTTHGTRLRWNPSDSVCNWVGVECDANLSYVFSLRLPGVNLSGPFPANTIGRLSQLRVLSLHYNHLSGKIPSDFSNLKVLRDLYLQDNLFSGEFPVTLTRLTRPTRLDLSSNKFTGKIPFAVNNLTHLMGLFLDNNGFSGNLPSITAANLESFNVSNNNLNGSIPKTLANFPASSFIGNHLCGGPLPPCS